MSSLKRRMDWEVYGLVRPHVVDDAFMDHATVHILEEAICAAIDVTHENGTPQASAEAVLSALRAAFEAVKRG